MTPDPLYQLPVEQIQKLVPLARSPFETQTLLMLVREMEQGSNLLQAAAAHALRDPEETIQELLELSGRSLSEALTNDSEPNTSTD